MINTALYRQSMRAGVKLLIILGLALTMYFTIIITMFDPALGSALNELAKAMPELMAMVGMTPAATTMAGFMAAYLYGFVMLVFPMIYSILTANRLVARNVDRGSMAYLLAAPVTRLRIVMTQILALLSGVVALVAYAMVVGIATCGIMFPGELEIGKFLLLNAGALALHLFIAGVCFLASTACNDAKYSVGFGAGIPALAFIIQMMANAGESLEGAKYFTFFTLFAPGEIISGETWPLFGMAALALGAAALFAIACTVFAKKDIPV